MKTFLYSLAFLIIGGLGLFGLLSMILPSQNSAIFTQLIIVVLVVMIGLFFFRRLSEWTGGGDQIRYKKAARQSQKRRKNELAGRRFRNTHAASKFRVIRNKTYPIKDKGDPLKLAKNHGHLSVIEGRKNKKRKKLLF